MDKSDKSPLTLESIAYSCTSGTCPTVYRTDRGTLVVQGYSIDAADAGVEIPEGERLVEIPVDLLLAAVDKVN
ncbi:hypothetical protein [Actinoplanes sp. NBRC 103695]|uniref:hypothetical protein n=1 Tax=Actinoplanes sp. NBRC 103695 TaxID=3032202 RepID=UPI0024A3BB80|nr:hypothetical protein [Actinoplanes sp. NBRC 103695]GLY95972.1 hypothetical protein Acsp02_32270 [Actinoplanes sp. NBRC 103695]